MDHYKQNAKLLAWFAPFRSLSVSAAFLVPFFLEKGLSQAEIFALQSIFSVAYLLWEIPSGFLADKFGRALSIKLSAPLAAVSMVAYGFSDHMWQFILCELCLAIANGLISGADVALLYDSLKADGKEQDFTKWKRRMDALGFASVAVAVPIAILLVSRVGVAATLVADGMLTFVGLLFVLRLHEPPVHSIELEQVEESAFKAAVKLLRNARARWLMILSAALSASTYFAFWLSAPYYESIGLPLASFSVVFAVRSLWKAWLAHHFSADRHGLKAMWSYIGLVAVAYVAMASAQPWLFWAILGFDVVQALHSQPILKKLNEFMVAEYRATLNSLSSLVNRVVFAVFGPLLGFVVDSQGLRVGLLSVACVGAFAAALALVRLKKLHAL